MILLTLSRGKGEETVRLQLPASPAEIGETFAFLDRISLDMALLDTTEEGSGFQERLLELLGEQHQEDHGGVFTDFGYAELGGEIKDIYVCQSNETACFHRSDAPVVLEVRKGFFNDPSYDNDKTAVLNLPAADAGIWRAVEKVDAASVDECAFRCVDCLIPFLRDAINNAIDDEDGIEQADEFAKRLAQIEREWPESDMVKYKALLSVVDHPSLQDATRLMGEIDQYELRPEVAQTWGYGYQIAVLDLRNPTRSDGNNLLHLINKYMDIYKADPKNLAAKAKAEKYSKILAKTLINTSGGDSAQYGQNAFFYDSAEGLLTAMFLLVAEYLPTEDADGNPIEKRHIVSVFKLVQELLAPSRVKGKNQFQLLLEKLPPNHKARWFAGSALNTAEQAMASVISTVLSRLNAFLDSEMEQILCFDTAIDAEKFCNEKSAIFIVLPEEDQTKYFMVSLILQNLYREILTVADENGGRLKNRVVFFADELGTCPPIQSLELMFSASRSRGLMLVPIVQSITGQLKKNYGAEGAEVIVDNCQVNLYGGFAPASQTAVELSKALGSRTVMSGSISRGKNDPSQSLQMIERPLMTPDELKSMPKGSFIVAKTGVHPMKVKLRLFLDWGIRFGEPYEVPEKAQRAVAYADKQELEESIIRRHYGTVAEEEPPQDVPAAVGGMNHGMQAEKNSRKTILRP